MLRLVCLSLCISASFAIVFHSPPSLAALGHIDTPMIKWLYQFVDGTVFGKNYTVQLAPDGGAGCKPDDYPDLWRGKVVWFIEKPCDTYLGHRHFKQLGDFQRLGAVAQMSVASGFGTAVAGARVPSSYDVNDRMIPWLLIRYQKNWNYAPDPVTNPTVPFKPLFKNALNENVTALLEYPDWNPLWRAGSFPASDFGFIVTTCIVMAQIAFVVAVVKLTQFIEYQGGIKFSLAQIVLFLVILSSFWLWFSLLWGNHLNSIALSDAPVAFFNSHNVPYWLSATVVYSFYLLEVCQLSANPSGGMAPTLQYFKIPAIVVCAFIFIAELTAGSLFASFPQSVDFPELFLMQRSVYIIVPSLVWIFLMVSTVNLIITIGDIANKIVIKTIIITFFLTCAIALLLLYPGLGLAKVNTWRVPILGQWAGLWFGSWIAQLTLALTFRVSVQKEIELSKSATSSTSSSSGSSSSSSSSSNSSDPVIEL